MVALIIYYLQHSVHLAILLPIHLPTTIHLSTYPKVSKPYYGAGPVSGTRLLEMVWSPPWLRVGTSVLWVELCPPKIHMLKL